MSRVPRRTSPYTTRIAFTGRHSRSAGAPSESAEVLVVAAGVLEVACTGITAMTASCGQSQRKLS